MAAEVIEIKHSLSRKFTNMAFNKFSPTDSSLNSIPSPTNCRHSQDCTTTPLFVAKCSTPSKDKAKTLSRILRHSSCKLIQYLMNFNPFSTIKGFFRYFSVKRKTASNSLVVEACVIIESKYN